MINADLAQEPHFAWQLGCHGGRVTSSWAVPRPCGASPAWSREERAAQTAGDADPAAPLCTWGQVAQPL